MVSPLFRPLRERALLSLLTSTRMVTIPLSSDIYVNGLFSLPAIFSPVLTHVASVVAAAATASSNGLATIKTNRSVQFVGSIQRLFDYSTTTRAVL